MFGKGLSDRKLEIRRKKWEDLMKKYEERGQLNTSECYFDEVNHKLFAEHTSNKKFKTKQSVMKKSKNLSAKGCHSNNDKENENKIKELPVTYLDVDISEIIDEDNNDIFTTNLSDSFNTKEYFDNIGIEVMDSGLGMCYKNVTEDILDNSSSYHEISFGNIAEDETDILKTNNSTNTNKCVEMQDKRNFHELKLYIEVTLKSELETMIINRNISKLLETNEYDHWHRCTKQEMKRLKKYITRNELKEYMKYCHHGTLPTGVDINIIKDIIVNKMNSNLQKLLVKRELTKHLKGNYLKYCKQVQLEWHRLCQHLPVNYLLLYGHDVLFTIEQLKGRKISVSIN